jgi:hypothetical protein
MAHDERDLACLLCNLPPGVRMIGSDEGSAEDAAVFGFLLGLRWMELFGHKVIGVNVGEVVRRATSGQCCDAHRAEMAETVQRVAVHMISVGGPKGGAS